MMTQEGEFIDVFLLPFAGLYAALVVSAFSPCLLPAFLHMPRRFGALAHCSTGTLMPAMTRERPLVTGVNLPQVFPYQTRSNAYWFTI